jgi:DNA-binding protein WhiA
VSFAQGVKDELARLPMSGEGDERALLAGLVRAGLRGDTVVLEHAGAARAGFRLAKRLGLAPALSLRVGPRHAVTYLLRLGASPERLRRELGVGQGLWPPYLAKRPAASAARAYVRGVFLAAGSVTHPAKGHHLEFALQRPELARELAGLLARRHMPVRGYLRRRAHVLYLKDGDAIARLIGWLGASEALLAFENARAWKDVRDDVNRMVNADAANVRRTVEAGLRQVAAVELLRRRGLLASLPDELQRTAELRLAHPEATLAELAVRLGVSKSGVNHRLRRLLRLAARPR